MNIDRLKWKKNSPYIYDAIINTTLTWPSFTVEWLPDITRPENKNYSIHRLVIGTCTDGSEPNSLIICKVTLPNFNQNFKSSDYDAERKEFGGFGYATVKFDTNIEILHNGAINRAKCVPQCPNLIATISNNTDIFLFDYTRHPSKPDSSGKFRPDLILKGHSKGGEGLAWCSKQCGLLISGSVDQSVKLWDICQLPHNEMDQQVITPIAEFNGHESEVEDISWHKFSSNIFGSVGGDGNWILWDSRDKNRAPIYKVCSSRDKSSALCIDFSPFNEVLLATGDESGILSLWDLRFPQNNLKCFEGHDNGIINIKWSPHSESILATSGKDGKSLLWNISHVNNTVNKEEIEKTGLVFQHFGQCSSIVDLSWNLNIENMLVTVSDQNSLQIWKPDSKLF